MPKVIKTVKGKEIEMEAEESQVETLLKDKRFRLAEPLSDEEKAMKARYDELITKGCSHKEAVKVIQKEFK